MPSAPCSRKLTTAARLMGGSGMFGYEVLASGVEMVGLDGCVYGDIGVVGCLYEP